MSCPIDAATLWQQVAISHLLLDPICQYYNNVHWILVAGFLPMLVWTFITSAAMNELQPQMGLLKNVVSISNKLLMGKNLGKKDVHAETLGLQVSLLKWCFVFNSILLVPTLFVRLQPDWFLKNFFDVSSIYELSPFGLKRLANYLTNFSLMGIAGVVSSLLFLVYPILNARIPPDSPNRSPLNGSKEPPGQERQDPSLATMAKQPVVKPPGAKVTKPRKAKRKARAVRSNAASAALLQRIVGTGNDSISNGLAQSSPKQSNTAGFEQTGFERTVHDCPNELAQQPTGAREETESNSTRSQEDSHEQKGIRAELSPPYIIWRLAGADEFQVFDKDGRKLRDVKLNETWETGGSEICISGDGLKVWLGQADSSFPGYPDIHPVRYHDSSFWIEGRFTAVHNILGDTLKKSMDPKKTVEEHDLRSINHLDLRGAVHDLLRIEV